ncbi:RibF FAD synthase [Flavobacteriaceae bacterium]
MKIYNSLYDFKPTKKTIVTLGTFDGVHIGHQKIIEKLLQNAKEYDCESLILTFFPHPRMVLQEGSDIKLLNTIDERSVLLDKLGLDNLIIHPFDKEFSQLSAEEFVKTILVDTFNIQKIIIGYDHRFGRNRTANIDDLILYGEKFGFEVEQISAQEINEVSISSTKIRNAILDGNMALANEYLGYNYNLSGIVSKGKQLGRTIGFPTANLKIAEEYKLIPKNGVYIVKSILNQITVFGIMNIGVNPTVNGENLSIEVHFLDFDADLYDEKITISIIDRIRDEQKFESVALLKLQLEKDKNTAFSYIDAL